MTKFPSLFRIPRHSRFNYEPRYYDPVREEIEHRTSRIRKEIERDRGIDMRTSMRENFARRSRASRTAGMGQIFIFAILAGGVVGWLFYGDIVFYLMLIVLPAYIYFRIRGKI